MKRALFAVTEGGIRLGLRIKEKLQFDAIYSMEKYCTKYPVTPFYGSLKETMKDAFAAYDEIVMIMSCGIAVRSIAPYLESKLKDPAVVVCDETGKFAVSLLSGHLGGANRLAGAVAEAVRGVAVITTASDRMGLEAVDMLAERINASIDSFEAAKVVTAVLVNGGRVGLLAEAGYGSIESSGTTPVKPEELGKVQLDALIYIGFGRELPVPAGAMPIVRLVPNRLVLGIGCRKNTDGQKILAAVNEFFDTNNLPVSAVCKVATIDIKQNEAGIIELAKELKAELVIVASGRIAEIEHLFEKSDFVKNAVGVGSVCEPAAYIASSQGECLIGKTKFNGITLCIYADSPEASRCEQQNGGQCEG